MCVRVNCVWWPLYKCAIQRHQPSDENWDQACRRKVWRYESSRWVGISLYVDLRPAIQYLDCKIGCFLHWFWYLFVVVVVAVFFFFTGQCSVFYFYFFFNEIIVQYKCLKERGFRGKRRGEKEVREVARVISIVLHHYLAASTLAHVYLTHTHTRFFFFL